MPQSPISERVFSLFDRKKGKTQAALARFCGITTGAVAQWRIGGIDFKHLPKIAKFFGVTEEWLRDGEIYVLSIDGTRKIKRLSKVKGGVEVISDNTRYKPETYTGDECDTMRIYGRVVEIIRKI